ncbi:MAG: PAS domain S-box protein [Proteobacteria bacterium]|nr:PAS domain S-box protein [Pseudomonadota bacterium]
MAQQEDVNRLVQEYQDLFELAPCYITVQDRNYRLLRYNREFSENFDAKLGEHCYKAYKDRSEKCPVCPVEKTFQDGQSHWSEESGYDKEGKKKYWVVRTNPIKNSEGETVAAMELCLDITHLKELEEQLQISEQKYHAIFDSIPNPVFVLDAQSLMILDCNDSVEAVYGYSPKDLIGKSFLELFRAEEMEENGLALKKLAFMDQVRHLTKEGRTIYVSVRVSPSKYLGREALIVTSSDISQRVEIEQQLIQASKMATLGEMATGIAHELNQPLSVIKTSSNFFMRKLNKEQLIEPKTLFGLANKISSNVDRASKIINHMREFGRKSFVNKEEVDVNKVLRDAYDILNQQFKLRGIEAVWSLQERLPMIMAEATRLEQVIINLLVNARDAIEDKIESEKGRRGEEKIFIRTHSDRTTVTIEVADTGPGIPEGLVGKIFEPFFTTKKVGKGTGLGLSISYGIVKDFGGTIEAVPTKGGGAHFVITFPIQGFE